MVCTNINITAAPAGNVTENYHRWFKSNGDVCGNVPWNQIANETILVKVSVTNPNAAADTVVIRVDWTETNSSGTTSHYSSGSGTIGGNATVMMALFDSGLRKYEQGTTYVITKVTIDDVVQTASQPSSNCASLIVGTGAAVTPTVTITNVGFAYQTSGACVALNSNCEESLTLVSNSFVCAKYDATCSAKAKYKVKMVYVNPAGVTKTYTSGETIQEAGTQGWCMVGAEYWGIGNYSSLSVTAIDILAG